SGRRIGGAGTRYDRPGGNVSQTKAVVESEERFPVHRLIHQTNSASHYCVAFAGDVPGKAEARTEVGVIRVVWATDAVDSNLNQSGGRIGIEIAQPVMSL